MASSNSSRLTGTALLAALTIVIDYAFKFSGLKIPFPWMPTLKFDFTGIPIALSLLMYGLPSALTTSTVALVAIVARSGDIVGATMKFASEFSTILGLAVGMRFARRLRFRFTRASGTIFGISFRVSAMSLANLVVLPAFYGLTTGIVYSMLPLIAAFNVAQGAITIFFGIFIYQAVIRRLRPKV